MTAQYKSKIYKIGHLKALKCQHYTHFIPFNMSLYLEIILQLNQYQYNNAYK